MSARPPNYKQQLEPMLDKIAALPEELGKPECLLADTGYFSAANVAACDKAGIEPLIAMGRQPHHPPLAERFGSGAGSAARSNAGRGDGDRLTTPAGGALYALRKQMPEPVFGIIKLGTGIPSIFAARPRGRARRMEPRHHGLEHQADIRLRPGLTRLWCAGSVDRFPQGNAIAGPFNRFLRPTQRPAPPQPPKSFAAITRKPSSTGC